jgi:flavin-dependent dehydrogenase
MHGDLTPSTSLTSIGTSAPASPEPPVASNDDTTPSVEWIPPGIAGDLASRKNYPDQVMSPSGLQAAGTEALAQLSLAPGQRVMDDSQQGTYDILIIGARVAGASLALLLGERGYRVLMVDRDLFPSDTFSTHFLNSRVVALLNQLGVLADIEAAGFRHITRSRTYIEDCIFEGPMAPEGAFALAPRRDMLDATIIEHAERRGDVVFWERTHADGLIWEDGQVTGARLTSHDGEHREVRARVVVGADGKYSKVAKWVRAAAYHEVAPLRSVYYGYFQDVTPLLETAVELFFVQDRIGYIFPMQPGLDCLALELQPEEFAPFRADPQGVFEAIFRALPGMAARLRDARLTGKMMGTAGIPNHFRQAFGAGWALTGAAAYLKDPSTGFGIGDAIMQAMWLAEALDATLRGADWETTLSAFQRRRDETFLPAFEATLAVTREHDGTEDALAWRRGAMAKPHTARAIAHRLPSALSGILPAPMWSYLKATAQAFGAKPAADQTPVPA